MWDQWSAEQCSGKCGCGSPLRPPPPLPLEPPQISPPWKKNLNPPSPPPLLFLFPTTLSHPISTTAPLPAPGFCCTNQEQMSAGAVLKDPAVLDASHMLFIQRWRLTARLLVKPISKKKKKKKEVEKNKLSKCLQVPSKAVHIQYEHTFLSPPPHSYHISDRLLFLSFFLLFVDVREAGVKSDEMLLTRRFLERSPQVLFRNCTTVSSTHNRETKKKWPQF